MYRFDFQASDLAYLLLVRACLDVLENEKPWTYTLEELYLYEQLYKMDNVILSPHVAGWTIESKRKIADTLLEKIQDSNK